MRCPKCHYLSFDPEPRCRNCGYGLALEVPEATADAGADPDLALTTPSIDVDPLADLMLRTRPPSTPSRDGLMSSDPGLAAVDAASLRIRGPFDDPVAAPPSTGLPPPAVLEETPPAAKTVVPAKKGSAPPTTELPLFMTQSTVPAPDVSEPDIEPLIAVPAEPRPPLAVRRPAPDTPPRAPARPEPRRKLGPLDRDLLEDLQRFEKQERKDAAAETRAAVRASQPTLLPGPFSRLAAAAIDAALLGGLGAAVLAITLRWLDLPFTELRILPIVPTAAFLLIVNVGYLLIFTAAGGQTIGKMAAGIRVVDDGDTAETSAVSIRQALLRELLTVPSVLALGAGFLPGLVGEQRALHDRITHTRVVRA